MINCHLDKLTIDNKQLTNACVVVNCFLVTVNFSMRKNKLNLATLINKRMKPQRRGDIKFLN